MKWSEWATPIVPVPKKDGSIRLFSDYKVTVSSTLYLALKTFLQSLLVGRNSQRVDLRQAYHQLEMEEASKKYLTINTHMGLFQYNRLVLGIISAPAIWQRTIDKV